jgi:hypothetical protein
MANWLSVEHYEYSTTKCSPESLTDLVFYVADSDVPEVD